MSEIKRIAVMGSSISLLVRPAGDGVPYPRVLEGLLNRTGDASWLVENLSGVAATADDAPALCPRVVAMQPDVIVLHYGHVEAIRRPHSRAAWEWTHLHVPGRTAFGERIREAGRWYAAAQRRLGVSEQWTPAARFERLIDGTLAYLSRETSARFIVMEPNPWNHTIERYGPGSRGEIERYAAILQDASARYGATWLSLEEIARCDAFGRRIDALIPDGTHFSGAGHSAVALALHTKIARPAMPMRARRRDLVAVA